MKPLPLKTKVRVCVLALWESFKPGDRISSYFITKHVHRYVSKYIKDGSIDRYVREMKKDGLINYECPVRSKGEFIIV